MTELLADHESRFAKYRPLAKLGQGGMARVFLAIASGPAGWNKLVVLKEILDELADDPEFVAMFLDEARLAARLNHPNVVQTTEVGVEGRRYFICMEYLEGQPLNRVFMRARAKLTRGMMIRILVDTLNGLHHAHEVCDLDGTPLQVVHRDATPHNIFLTYAGQVKVVDFGIAKATSSSIKTQTGVLKGKVNYMSPEQARGVAVDRRADIFSVGMMLWDVLAGQRPFHGLHDVAIVHKLMLGEIANPRSVAPEIPEVLDAICMKALAFDREDRFATAADMATALEHALDETGDRGSVRDAGKIIAEEFAEEREDMKRVVETQVALIQGGAAASPEAGSAADVGRGELTVREPAVARVASAADSAHGESQASSITATATYGPRNEPSPPPAARARPYALMAVALIALVAAGVASSALTARHASPPSDTSALPTTPPTAAPAPVTRSIAIDSLPQGATITDGDLVLGTTPMTLKIDGPPAPARRLVMSLPGYAPHTFVPTVDDVRIQVPLAQLPTAAPTPSSAPARPTKPAGNTARPKPATAPDDIKMTR